MILHHRQTRLRIGSKIARTLRAPSGRRRGYSGPIVPCFVVEGLEEVDLLFIFGECCQEFCVHRYRCRCDLRTQIKNDDKRSEGTQRVKKMTDEFDPVP